MSRSCVSPHREPPKWCLKMFFIRGDNECTMARAVASGRYNLGFRATEHLGLQLIVNRKNSPVGTEHAPNVNAAVPPRLVVSFYLTSIATADRPRVLFIRSTCRVSLEKRLPLYVNSSDNAGADRIVRFYSLVESIIQRALFPVILRRCAPRRGTEGSVETH